jgi:hypothetical protein
VNIKLSAHNVVLIVLIAVLGIMAMRWAAKGPAGSLPVIGSVFRLGGTA